MRAKLLKFARLALPLSAALALASCSWITDLVVLNRSTERVVVEYTFKEKQERGRACCPGGGVPSKKALKDVKDDGVGWSVLAEDEYSYDAAVGRVTVMLRAGEALRVMRALNYMGREDAEDPDFALKSISLTGAKGTIYLEGLQAQTAFREESNDLYTLTY
ncbi:MAG TPA: hypothetical protein VGV38_03900 [Pyrinomonadaceae bacterium]|nr:hypothetical protein [Pyrinomonadaceae bacterium]